MSKDNKAQKSSGKINQKGLVRLAKESDLAAILDIEQASFPLPWTEPAFRSEFRNPYSHLWVLEENFLVVGYVCTWFIHNEGQIVNAAVLPKYRRGGRGYILVQYAMQEARRQGVQLLSLEVRSSNRAAFALYTRFGFQKVAVRKRYYENGEDALLMVCNLSTPSLSFFKN